MIAALGGNLGGITSWLLSLDGGQLAAALRADIVVPVNGFKRCYDAGYGFGECGVCYLCVGTRSNSRHVLLVLVLKKQCALPVSSPSFLIHTLSLLLFCSSRPSCTEFLYPSYWLADQTLFFRAAQRAEAARSLDPPALRKGPRARQVVEPSAAFGPPGSRWMVCGLIGHQ